MFRPLDFSKLKRPLATVATVATIGTERTQSKPNVAAVATVASSNSDPASAYGSEPIDPAAIEERAALAADRVPSVYLDGWSRLNHQKPEGVSEGAWRQALGDGGRFLDTWGRETAACHWTPGELFDVRAGLVWRLAGASVEALGPHHARLSDGRTEGRSAGKTWQKR